MTDQSRESGAILDPAAAPPDRAALAAATEDESVGYARADLKDALARIRDTTGPTSIGDAERGRSTERSAADAGLLEEVRTLGADVHRLIELAESIRASTASSATASTAMEERLATLAARFEEAQSTQARADARLLGLSIVVIVLTVVVLALLVIDIVPRPGG